MNRKRIFSITHLTVTALLGAATLAQGNLLIDFEPTGGDTVAGYQSFGVLNNDNPPSSSHAFPAFGTTITVNLTTANLQDGYLDYRSVPRDGAVTDVYNDWVGVDTREGGVDVTLTLEFVGLPTGDYDWLSYHEDGGTGTTNGNLDGGADYFFTDANGTASGLLTFAPGNAANPTPATFATSFSSDGINPVSFSMVMDHRQPGAGTSANALFAFIGGAEITAVAIPEPSSLALFGLVLAGAVIFRRRQ